MKYWPLPANRRWCLPTYCSQPIARKSGAVLLVARTANDPVRPSNGETGCPAEAVTATFGPDANPMRQFHLPVLSGETCARHLLPGVADVLAALPSAAKYPGTS